MTLMNRMTGLIGTAALVMLVGAQSALDDRQLGFVAAWDINATAVAIGLATFLIARLNWRHLALAGLCLIMLGNFWTAVSHDYEMIVAARICAGLGEGLAIAVCFAALGCSPNPDRAFGIYLVVGLTVAVHDTDNVEAPRQDPHGAASAAQGCSSASHAHDVALRG